MTQPLADLTAALSAYDRKQDRDDLKLAENERAEVTRLFSLEFWQKMRLQDYALGQSDSPNTFCLWMEFRTQHLGSMKGGNAKKLIIYKRRNEPGWYHDPKWPDEESAWIALRADFLQAFDAARNQKWGAIEELTELQRGPALCLKALHTYFPKDFLPVYSQDHLRHFLSLMDVPEDDSRTLEAVSLNRLLLEKLRARNDLASWTTNEMQRFLYTWADPRQRTRIVKMAPGERGEFWEDCLRAGYMCVGWDDVGDLNDYENKDAFRAEFERKYLEMYNGKRQAVTTKSNELWTLTELEPGDVVVANRGTSEVLGVGEVVEPGYSWHPERASHKHTVAIKWDASVGRSIPPQKRWAFITVGAMSPALYESLLGRAGPRTIATAPIDPRFVDIAAMLSSKGQVILYGPPGTGKTYQARRFSVAWLLEQNGRAAEALDVLSDTKRFAQEEAALARAPPGDEVAAQLTRLTFHPSYSYEDFIEGFRPVADKDRALQLRLEAGVFKRVCRAAQAAPKKKFLVLIDEINRANLAKVFGELITLLERDKRDLTVVLPQSKEPFAIPGNVYLLGTMNTADRSIKLLDAALRRRFAFIELMPDVEILHGAKVGILELDNFLRELNRRIAQNEGREKQIGHSFLLNGTEPVSEPEDFARRFRMEILPLLQEYCYDDYAALASYIGIKLVHVKARSLDEDCLNDADALIEALELALRRVDPDAE